MLLLKATSQCGRITGPFKQGSTLFASMGSVFWVWAGHLPVAKNA
jgi:hypothetical protein